jgi:hypothetical protein
VDRYHRVQNLSPEGQFVAHSHVFFCPQLEEEKTAEIPSESRVENPLTSTSQDQLFYIDRLDVPLVLWLFVAEQNNRKTTQQNKVCAEKERKSGGISSFF